MHASGHRGEAGLEQAAVGGQEEDIGPWHGECSAVIQSCETLGDVSDRSYRRRSSV